MATKVHVVLVDGGDQGATGVESPDLGSVTLIGVFSSEDVALDRVIAVVEGVIASLNTSDLGEGVAFDILRMRDKDAEYNDRLLAAENIFESLVGDEQGSISMLVVDLQ